MPEKPWEMLNGQAVTIPHRKCAHLPIDTHLHGSSLLDLADPENPTFKKAGVYAVTASVHRDRAGGNFYMELLLNVHPTDIAHFADAEWDETIGSLTVVGYMKAGASMFVQACNGADAGDRDFLAYWVNVQRIGA